MIDQKASDVYTEYCWNGLYFKSIKGAKEYIEEYAHRIWPKCFDHLTIWDLKDDDYYSFTIPVGDLIHRYTIRKLTPGD